MKDLMKGKLDGLTEQMTTFSKKLDAFDVKKSNVAQFNKLLMDEMKLLSFDDCSNDRFDNTVGVVKGFRHERDMALIYNIDYPSDTAGEDQTGETYKAGVICALYSAALMKRTLLPMTGDIVVCGVPRSGCSAYGARYLFDYYLNQRVKDIMGIILCEPTDHNVYLGHRGHMEYEIVVKVKLSETFAANRGINMLGTMFPLIHELETLSRSLPTSQSLGNSSLKIKDVHFCGTKPKGSENEFKVIVDRTFGTEEQEENILERAKMIAQSVYKSECSVQIETDISREDIKTLAGTLLRSSKHTKPWMIESHHPFVANSIQALNDAGHKTGCGYWKKNITAGSYTFSELGIPTIGYGPGLETATQDLSDPATLAAIKKAVLGNAMILQRNIGVPTFGWSSDEI